MINSQPDPQTQPPAHSQVQPDAHPALSEAADELARACLEAGATDQEIQRSLQQSGILPEGQGLEASTLASLLASWDAEETRDTRDTGDTRDTENTESSSVKPSELTFEAFQAGRAALSESIIGAIELNKAAYDALIDPDTLGLKPLDPHTLTSLFRTFTLTSNLILEVFLPDASTLEKELNGQRTEAWSAPHY